MIKDIQLFLHRNYDFIKHWLLVMLGIMLLVFSMIVIAGQNRLLSRVAEQGHQIEVLTKENKQLNLEAKKLGKDNQDIAKQNRSFTLCGFQVFAKFTRDFQPIQNLDLATCTTDSQSKATQDSATGGTPESTSGNTSAESSTSPPSSSDSLASSPNNTTPTQPSQSNSSQPDNEGVIIDLPFLPRINVPSPF